MSKSKDTRVSHKHQIDRLPRILLHVLPNGVRYSGAVRVSIGNCPSLTLWYRWPLPTPAARWPYERRLLRFDKQIIPELDKRRVDDAFLGQSVLTPTLLVHQLPNILTSWRALANKASPQTRQSQSPRPGAVISIIQIIHRRKTLCVKIHLQCHQESIGQTRQDGTTHIHELRATKGYIPVRTSFELHHHPPEAQAAYPSRAASKESTWLCRGDDDRTLCVPCGKLRAPHHNFSS